MRHLLAALAVATLAAHAAHAAGTPRSVELATSGDGPYYTLHLPMALQAESSSPDWTDLRVLNASGEPLPFAWIEAWPADAREHQRAVPVFKLPGAASGARTGPSRGWLLDVRGIEGTLLKVELIFPEAARGLYTLSVEASDDMQHWRVLQPSVQVLSLEKERGDGAQRNRDAGHRRETIIARSEATKAPPLAFSFLEAAL